MGCSQLAVDRGGTMDPILDRVIETEKKAKELIDEAKEQIRAERTALLHRLDSEKENHINELERVQRENIRQYREKLENEFNEEMRSFTAGLTKKLNSIDPAHLLKKILS